jgi:hypothetical protein
MIWRAIFGFVSKLSLFVATLTAMWFGGRKSAKINAKLEGLEGYVDTRKRMDEVDVGDDPAVLRDWLRGRAKR